MKCFEKTWIKNENTVKCLLCPRECSLSDGEFGFCRVRVNKNNELHFICYGANVIATIDSLRKRPIYLWPDSKIKSLSIGSFGCNNICPFCQNHTISQVDKNSLNNLPARRMPQDILNLAKENEVDFVSFSFNEPIVNFEYFCDVSDLVRKNGFKVCLKTSAHISFDMAIEMISRSDAINVDIKPMKTGYSKECGIIEDEAVYDFIRLSLLFGKHVEISHILIEGINDNIAAMSKFCQLMCTIDNNIGVHLLRHYPIWKYDFPMTSDETMKRWGEYCQLNDLKNVFWNDID